MNIIYSFVFNIFWRLFCIPVFLIVACLISIVWILSVIWLPFSVILFGEYIHGGFDNILEGLLDFLFYTYWEIGEDITENIDNTNFNIKILNNNFWK